MIGTSMRRGGRASFLLASWVAALALPCGADVRETYEEARARTGRDADAQVELSIWCERNGLAAEAEKHLALALLIDPDHAKARGLRGQVAHDGGWARPDAVVEEERADSGMAALRAEYEAMRGRAEWTADDQWRLAVWCGERELEAESKAHAAAVIRLDPSRDAAWRRLGYVKRDGRWMTDSERSGLRAEGEAQAAADRGWVPRLEALRRDVRSEDAARREAAERELFEISDPRAVPAIGRVFGNGDEADQRLAVALLGQIDAPAASRAASVLAVASESAEVRRIAAETLRLRDPREFAGPLVAMIRDPLRYEVRPVGGPGSPGVLYVAGEEFDTRRFYSVAAPVVAGMAPPPEGVLWGWEADGTLRTFGQGVSFLPPNRAAADALGQLAQAPGDAARILAEADARGANRPIATFGPGGAAGLASVSPFAGWLTTVEERAVPDDVRNSMIAQQATARANSQLEQDVRAIEASNAYASAVNERVLPVLRVVMPTGMAEDRASILAWWGEEIGRQGGVPTGSRPVVNQFVQFTPGYVRETSSCFAAGTPVWTRAGLRPIEELHLGDQVLAQDPTSGELSYQPLVGVHHNPPAETIRMVIDGEEIVVSRLHRFWIDGRGWVAAHEMKAGDRVRLVGRVGAVDSALAGEAQPVFNLEVATARSFFVGEVGALVHDFTLVEPVARPFDSAAVLAAE